MCIYAADIVHKDHATNQAHKDCKIDEVDLWHDPCEVYRHVCTYGPDLQMVYE